MAFWNALGNFFEVVCIVYVVALGASFVWQAIADPGAPVPCAPRKVQLNESRGIAYVAMAWAGAMAWIALWYWK